MWLPLQDVKLAADALVVHPWDKVLVAVILARHFLQAEVLRATTRRQYRHVQAHVHAHINTAILAANGWPLLAAGATNGWLESWFWHQEHSRGQPLAAKMAVLM